ncbi:peptidylprolyl isomerase [Candidatus Sumerlaeota bacterium]|nr:peptidylprolyl isomerase [Candidatus Sumerlaeota bacterium]
MSGRHLMLSSTTATALLAALLLTLSAGNLHAQEEGTASGEVIARMHDPVADQMADLIKPDLVILHALQPLVPGKSIEEILNGDFETTLKPATLEYAYRELMAIKAKNDPDYDLQGSIARNRLLYLTQLMKYIPRAMLNEEIRRKALAGAVNGEEIQKYYEEHREDYNKPVQFFIQNIFLMTYEEYKVQDGDTLESIAEKISGDVEKKELIRSKERPHQTLAEEAVPHTDGEGVKEAVALTSGMLVLAPMNAEKKAEVRKRMESIKQEVDQLGKGGDFGKLAREYSESERKGEVLGPFPQGDAPMLDVIFNTAMELPVGGVSAVLETKHGYQIIKVVQKNKATSASVEQVAPQIRTILLNLRKQEVEREFYQQAMTAAGIQFNEEALALETNDPETVVAELGDLQYRWKDLRYDSKGKVPGAVEQRKELIYRNRMLMEHALNAHMDRNDYWDSPRYAEIMRLANDFLLYIDYEMTRAIALFETDDAAAQEFFKKNRQVFNVPDRYDIIEISRKIPADAHERERQAMLDEMRTLAMELNSLEAVEKKAKELVEQPEQGGLHGAILKDVEANYRGETLGRELSGLNVGYLYGPQWLDDELILLWLVQKTPGESEKFEDVKERVVNIMARSQLESLIPKVRDQIMPQIQIEWAESDAAQAATEQ